MHTSTRYDRPDALTDCIDWIEQAYVNEPDWQHTFWGDNYERLLKIKKKYDPWDVLWCHPCVGSEGWKVVDNVLCKA